MTILITGARGGIGASLLHRLHTSGHQVRAASRAAEKIDLPVGSTAVRLDLADPTTFPPALAGVSDMFLYAEPAGIEALLDAAVAGGVRRVVLLSSDSVTLRDADQNAIARHHLQVEQAVAAASVTSTVLRPGGFATMTTGWAEAIRAGYSVEQAYPDTRLDVIHPEDIADVAEQALTTDTLDGQTLSLGGPQMLSFRDQARTLGTLLDREIALSEASRERAITQLSSHVPAPFVESVLDYWDRISDGRTDPARSVERITGRPGRSFHQWADENLATFREGDVDEPRDDLA